MKNITQLRDSLAADYMAIRAGRMKLPTAKETTAKANSMISACKVELAYFAQRKEAPVIPFLEIGKRVKGRIVSDALPQASSPKRLTSGSKKNGG